MTVALPPTTSACLTALGTVSGTVTRNGQWVSDCASANRNGRYARYYSFTVDKSGALRIDLTSTVDAYAYLLSGNGESGTVLAFDDDGGTGRNSQIQHSLDAGTYTVEATTYAAGKTGSFDLAVEFSPAADCLTALGIVSGTATRLGQWLDDGCTSGNRSGRYARYYSFTPGGAGEVQIDLESSTDAYLYLLSGDGKGGAKLAEDDDSGSDRNSRITHTLATGTTYTIEATTYASAKAGTHTLKIKAPEGFGGNPPPVPTLSAPGSDDDGTYSVSWTSVTGTAGGASSATGAASGESLRYELQEQVGSGSWTSAYTGSNTSELIRGKTEGSYSYRVRACFGTLCSAWSPEGLVTVPPISPPSDSSVPTETENGSFSVSWSNPAYARHSELQKSSDGKTWTDISVAEGTYSTTFSGHPAGRYQFRVRACVISTWCSAYTAPKTALVGPVPTPEGLDSQSKYSYEIRIGDFDGDGRKDVLLDRKPGGSANDGSLDSTILHQKTAGVLTASAPTATELANARTYPLSTNGTSKAGDLNFDGFADRILMGLESEVGVGLNEVAVFAPGEPFVSVPMGVKALDDDYMRFWHEVGEYAKDPEFFKNNTKRTTRPVFQFGLSCGSYYSWLWLIFDYLCFVYPVNVSVETVTVENFHPESRNFAQAMDAFVAASEYTEAELRAVDDALFAVLGVHSFGLRDGSVHHRFGEERAAVREHAEEGWFVGACETWFWLLYPLACWAAGRPGIRAPIGLGRFRTQGS